MAQEAMDEVRREEMRAEPGAVKTALGSNDRKLLKSLTWGMRRNPKGWSKKQTSAMHWLQHSRLKSARAWRLKMALREVYARAVASNDEGQARADLKDWLSWAQRCKLEPFKKLAKTISQRLDAVVRGMLDNRSNFNRAKSILTVYNRDLPATRRFSTPDTAPSFGPTR